jgi:hypothetical protein
MEEKNELTDKESTLADKMAEYIKMFDTDSTITDDYITNLEHKIFYVLQSRERIEEKTFKGENAKEWITKYGPETTVFRESEVLNFMKKHKIK